jgi:glycosyltransferase involved in cell wall biosynthesis
MLPSYNEGMSVALMEALASGLPVIVTETGGTAELVKDNGFIVPWADPAALAGALEKFLLQPALCREMGQRSLEIAADFSWERTTHEYLNLSNDLLVDSNRIG